MNIRHMKIIVLCTIALYFTFLVFNNFTNFDSNFKSLKSVFEMEGVFDTHLISWRAISNSHIQQGAFFFLIAWQILTALLCWGGSLVMFKNIHADHEKFSESKKIALAGLTAGFLFFMIGFVIIGSEWFNMWQSMWKNLQLKTLVYAILLLGCMIFVSTKEEEKERV